jgi:prephenate dehydrogenase
VIDQISNNIAEAIQNADIILIATPVAQTPDILRAIKPYLSKHTVVTDAGSTKSDVLDYANEILGDLSPQFVGGHPIAGAEKSGVSAASNELFLHKNVVLTPTASTQQQAIDRVEELWKSCGATVSLMSAPSHDSIFAAVSHLPHLLAFALVNDIASRPNADQLFSFAASGFRDFTRIAGSNPEMWRDISLANKNALLSELNAFQAEIGNLKNLLENEDSEGLQALFERASFARNAWAKSNQKK